MDGSRRRSRDRSRSRSRGEERGRGRDRSDYEGYHRRSRSRSRDRNSGRHGERRRKRSRSNSRDSFRNRPTWRSKERHRDKGRGPGVCYAFQKGECKWGDNCRFSHSRSAGGKDKDSSGLSGVQSIVSQLQGDGGEKKPKWGKAEDEEESRKKTAPEDRQKANFGLSGALNEDAKTGKMYNGVILKWSEPPDAHVPKKRWRVYVFKDDALLDTYHIHRQSAYLIGREKKIADILTEHPSCSKQHAVIQYRVKTTYPTEAGSIKKPKRTVQPYILDLESTNGTFLNGERIEPARYIEIFEKDVLKFGQSKREYVFLREDSNSKQ